MQSDSNSIKPVFKPAERGVIYDRNGLALTKNTEQYQLFLYIESRVKARQFVKTLSEVLILKYKEKRSILRKVLKARRGSVVLLMNSMTWGDLARVESAFYKLDGAIIESRYIRSCLFPHELAHLMGYVATPSKRDIKNSDDLRPVLLSPGYRIGKSGLEKAYENSLRGKYGVKYVEVNSADKPIRVASEKKSTMGDSLITTIDVDLQKYAYQRIVKEVACVSVMDIKTGEILVCTSSPSFDINRLSQGVSYEYWQKISKDKNLPLNNRVISAIYPPGSVFKIITAIAALEEGLNPAELVNCKGHIEYGNRRLHCWKKEGHGKVDLVQALQKSCNVYFFEIAKTLGMKKINEVAGRFGYGQKFDLGLDGVSAGNLPDEDWKQQVYKQRWVGGDTLNCAIGQGFVLSTPLQLTLGMARFANGGYKINPSLVRSSASNNQIELNKVEKIIKNESHYSLISEALNNVVNQKKGTAYYQRIKEKGFEMAGKTGTSQVVSKREDEMTKSESRRRRNKNHAIFAGYAPVQSPKYSISVVVEHGGSGSVAAAPVARDILLKAQKLNIR